MADLRGEMTMILSSGSKNRRSHRHQLRRHLLLSRPLQVRICLVETVPLTTTMPKYTAREKRRVYRVLAPALLSRTVRLEYEICLPVMICNAADEGGNEHGCMKGWAG